MGKMRVYEFAKEVGASNKEVIDKAKAKGIELKNHMSSIDDSQAKDLRGSFSPSAAKPTATKPEAATEPPKTIVQPTVKSTATPLKNEASSSESKDGAQALKPRSKRYIQPANSKPVQRTANRHPNTSSDHNSQARPTNQTNQGNGGNRPLNQSTSRPQNSSSARPTTTNSRPVNNSTKPTNSSSQSRPVSNNRPATNNQSRSTTNQNRSATNNSQNRPTTNQNTRPVNNNSQNRSTNSQGRPTNNNNSSNNRPNNNNQNRSYNNSTSSNQNNRPSANNTTPRRNDAPAASANGSTNSSNNNRRTNNYNKGGQQGGNRPTYNSRNRYDDNRYNNRRGKKNRRRDTTPKAPVSVRKEWALPETLMYTEGMNVADIAKKIHREPAEIIKKLFMLGVMVNQNQSLDKDTIEILAADYGINAEEKVEVDIADIDKFFEEEETSTDNLKPRPPVVTIMGHVDHGKTTLLDKLRHTSVSEDEAGGITQHIGAYQVKLNDRLITFLDTPGHAAFTNMRARGADITDIIILVVAADDGVMPQTIEAINHAKAAKAPIIVAVNKIDKPGANPNHVMEQLTEYGLIPESWGGETIFVEISAKFGKNLDQLLEMILLEADMLELKANPDQKAIGTVIEASLDKGRGTTATLLVQQGTLHVGDPIVVGNTFGRVRVMNNDQGRRVKVAAPSTPVEITGLNDVPQAADRFVVFEDEKTARAAGEERAKRAQLVQRGKTHRVTLDNLFESLQEGELKEVDVIIKGDVQGSVEALAGSLEKIEVEGVRVNIIHTAVGAINESDVTLAEASNAIIIGFNVRPTPQAKQQASEEDVDIRLHRVIYKAIDEIETAMKGMLEPEYEEKVTGQLVVREIYKVSKVGTIAGSFVTEGFIRRESGIRLIRDGIVIYEGKLSSLKRFKDDVKEVRQGFECGVTIENYNDIKVDDQIEAYIMEEIPVE